MIELAEIWELFKERYINRKKTVKSERILFWKLKYKLDRFIIDPKLPENYYSDPFFNDDEC